VTEVDLSSLLGELGESVKTEMASTPEVIDKGKSLQVDDLPIIARKWHKVSDVVAVVADLKNSTKLGTGKWAASTASIYEASTGGVVKILNSLAADFIAIQGDGAFGLFWGDRRYERGICAGITIKTFSSRELVPKLEGRWNDLPETGYKVGIASSRILAKRVGTPRNPAQQEPVWAGKAVNYAAKAAQCSDRHIMTVTGSVWDRIEMNDFLALSCPCDDGPSANLWSDVTIDRLPEGEAEAHGRSLSAEWCKIHGADYCKAVLDGKRQRDDVADLRVALTASQMEDAVRWKAAKERLDQRARQRGLGTS
jgi:class 3 adenylate cyclase